MFRHDLHHGGHEFGRRQADYCGQREKLGHAHVPFTGDQSTEGGVTDTGLRAQFRILDAGARPFHSQDLGDGGSETNLFHSGTVAPIWDRTARAFKVMPDQADEAIITRAPVPVLVGKPTWEPAGQRAAQVMRSFGLSLIASTTHPDLRYRRFCWLTISDFEWP